MKENLLPTPEFQIFNDSSQALDYINKIESQCCNKKADGLAAGKGVFVTDNNKKQL